MGEAITSAAVGTSSVAARDAWTVTEEEYIPASGMSSLYKGPGWEMWNLTAVA